MLTGDQRKGQEAQLAAGADYSNSASHKQIRRVDSVSTSSSRLTWNIISGPTKLSFPMTIMLPSGRRMLFSGNAGSSHALV